MGNKGDALREGPGTQRVLRHISGCFGEDKQRSPKVLLARQIHQPGPRETTPSSKAWMSARNGSCGSFQQGSLRNVSGTKAIGRPTEKCGVSGKGFHETGPRALHQEGKMSSHSEHYASAACAGLGLPLLARVTTSNGVDIYSEVLCLQNYFNHVCWLCRKLQNDQFRKFNAVGLFPDD